jgi:hypothetical protein
VCIADNRATRTQKNSPDDFSNDLRHNDITIESVKRIVYLGLPYFTQSKRQYLCRSYNDTYDDDSDVTRSPSNRAC